MRCSQLVQQRCCKLNGPAGRRSDCHSTQCLLLHCTSCPRSVSRVVFAFCPVLPLLWPYRKGPILQPPTGEPRPLKGVRVRSSFPFATVSIPDASLQRLPAIPGVTDRKGRLTGTRLLHVTTGIRSKTTESLMQNATRKYTSAS